MDTTEFAKNLDIFSKNVYEQLITLNEGKNIIFSPFSIQTCAAMARMGAEKETAQELESGLQLSSSVDQEIADSFGQALAEYETSNILKIANKLYLKTGYNIRKEFKDILTNNFRSEAESINFEKSSEAAKAMNTWVESKTNNLIKDLISPDLLDAKTRLVLINAIHFKGEWKTKFDEANTRDEDFYLNDADTVKVPMMNLESKFLYADLPNLDAKVLEMPYKDSDLSMLVILPNKKTGLKILEEQLKDVQLADITSKLYMTKVIVKFPKFKAEFEQELTKVFQNLGMTRMFSDAAQFGKILQEDEELKVSSIVHKAFIEVNEEGTEAAAATAIIFAQITSVGARPLPPKRFIADRPFYFIIKNTKGLVLFAGKNLKF